MMKLKASRHVAPHPSIPTPAAGPSRPQVTSFFGTLRSELDGPPQLPSGFALLAAHTQLLLHAYDSGQLDQERLAELLAQQRCFDTVGNCWTIGATTGNWYRRAYDGTEWVAAPAPTVEATGEPIPGTWEQEPAISVVVGSDAPLLVPEASDGEFSEKPRPLVSVVDTWGSGDVLEDSFWNQVEPTRTEAPTGVPPVVTTPPPAPSSPLTAPPLPELRGHLQPDTNAGSAPSLLDNDDFWESESSELPEVRVLPAAPFTPSSDPDGDWQTPATPRVRVVYDDPEPSGPPPPVPAPHQETPPILESPEPDDFVFPPELLIDPDN